MNQQKDNIPPKPRQSLLRRLLKWTMRIMVVLVVLGIVAWAAASYWAARAIANEVARIRAAGQPVTFAELEAAQPVASREQDSGPYYEAAMALARNDLGEVPNYDDAKVTMTPATLAVAEGQLEKQHLALEMLDRAADLPGCNYDFGLTYGMAVLLPRLNEARVLAAAASLRTRTLAYTGKGDQAAESAIASLRMLRMFDRQPVLIVNLVRLGCTAIFCRDVQAILEHGHPSPEALAKIEKALAESERPEDFGRVCVAERVFYLEVVRNIIAGGRELQGADAPPPLPESQQTPTSLPIQLMVAQVLPGYARFVEAGSKGFPQAIDAMNALLDSQPRSRFDFWQGIMAPALRSVSNGVARGLAASSTTRVAILVELYRHTHGRLPQSLAELPQAAALPLDPFSGRGLLYHSTADGHVVYSVGENRRDDGGTDLSNRETGDEGISVRVGRP